MSKRVNHIMQKGVYELIGMQYRLVCEDRGIDARRMLRIAGA